MQYAALLWRACSAGSEGLSHGKYAVNVMTSNFPFAPTEVVRAAPPIRAPHELGVAIRMARGWVVRWAK
jgi:hypothetical protein